MSVLSLEAKVVLFHLNEMGYRNITAEQLKEFIKDLKKLIKYEERLGVLTHEIAEKTRQKRFEQLHKTLTVSSKAKTIVKTPEKQPTVKKTVLNKRNCDIRENVVPIVNNTSKLVSSANKETDQNKVIRKPRSVKPVKPLEPTKDSPKSKMWIRPRSITPSRINRMDPVKLYAYYQKEWERFKDCMPGENNRDELRWKLRHKLLGS